MSLFKVIPQRTLSEELFDEFPVWSEYYEWDELEEIEGWGLDREVVLKMLNENSIDNEHCLYTLLEANPFPKRMRIFIGARITTAGGVELKGYVMNEDAYCLCIIHDGAEYFFSCHPTFKGCTLELANKLSMLLNVPASDFFPLHYETDYYARDGSPIAGTFMYGQE